MLDRLMKYKDRKLYCSQHFHGSIESANKMMRAHALLINYMQRNGGKILLQEEQIDDVKEGKTDMELFVELQKDERKFAAFNRAVARLCKKCRKLFDKILVEGVKLKGVWEELEYRNYRAIVDAKYHCKKELKRRVLEEMRVEIASLSE